MRLASLLVAAVVAAGQPASDLLQSAIYAQESKGDLDAAIRIYRQILSAGAGQRMYAPQAQFRLGQCLLRRGDRHGAIEAFQAVIRNFPEQAELVARAREAMPVGEGLLPRPWQDREVAEYRWSVAGAGPEDAWSITHIAPSPRARGDDCIQLHYYLPAGHKMGVDVQRDSMLPTGVNNLGVPRRQGPNSAYEAAELVYLLRRWVLSPGVRGSMPLNLPNGDPVKLQFAVEAKEDVTVPAGKFSCYRVRLSVPRPHLSILEGTWTVPADGEVLWYAIGGGRPLVKMKAGGAIGELTALRVAEAGGQSVQRDPVLGYSLVLPSDWVQHTRAAPDRQMTTIDLHAIASDLGIRIILTPWSARNERLETVVSNRIRTQASRHPVYTVRGRPAAATLAGHAGLSWMADMDGQSEFGICAPGETLLATITVQAPTAEFEHLRAQFQPILDSFRLR
jgi:hypothetical protein